jgi:hypothetical protein
MPQNDCISQMGIEFDHPKTWAKECPTNTRQRYNSQMRDIYKCLGTHEMGQRITLRSVSQMGIKKLFYMFKPIIPLLPNSLLSRLVKLGPRMTRRLEKGAQEIHVFSRNQDHI